MLDSALLCFGNLWGKSIRVLLKSILQKSGVKDNSPKGLFYLAARVEKIIFSEVLSTQNDVMSIIERGYLVC